MNERKAARRLLFRHLRMIVEGKRDGRLEAAKAEIQTELDEFGAEVEHRTGKDARALFMAIYEEERAAQRAMIQEGEPADTVTSRPQPPWGKGAALALFGWFVFAVVFTVVMLLGRR